MNSRPIVLRFSSGSVMPASAAAKWSWARTCTSGTPKCLPKAASTCSPSLWRISPWSTKTHVRRSPMARCTISAATALSTPPESPQMARASPTCPRMRSTCSSMRWVAVQVGEQSQASNRNHLSRSLPKGVWTTSGWNCTPYIRRSGFSMAATGEEAVWAVTANPSGARDTASRWLIQHCSAGRAWNMPSRDLTAIGVLPYSPAPVRATSPPRARVIACRP